MKYRKRVRYLGYRAVVTIYPAPAAGNHTPKGLARKETTPEEKKRQHQYQVWKLQGLILANFLPREDQFVTLTLPAGTTEEQARKARSGFLGACRRECSRQGKVFRYLCFLEKQGMVFNQEDNPTTDLINGIIRIRMLFSPYPPAEQILTTVEYDTTALQEALK